MNKLPNEITIKILNYLDYDELKVINEIVDNPICGYVIKNKKDIIIKNKLNKIFEFFLVRSIEENYNKKFSQEIYNILFDFFHKYLDETWFIHDNKLFAFFLYEWLIFNKIYKIDGACKNIKEIIAKHRWDVNYLDKLNKLEEFYKFFSKKINKNDFNKIVEYSK